MEKQKRFYKFNSRGVAVEAQGAFAGVVATGVQTRLFQEGVLIGRNFSRSAGREGTLTTLS